MLYPIRALKYFPRPGHYWKEVNASLPHHGQNEDILIDQSLKNTPTILQVARRSQLMCAESYTAQ